MKRTSDFILQKSSDSDRNSLNISILTTDRQPVLTLSINEETRELSIYISSKSTTDELDFEALTKKITEAKAALLKWADDAKDPEEGWEE